MIFSREGKPKTLQNAVMSLKSKLQPAIIVGGFPHGHFSKKTLDLADTIVCVDPEMLEPGVLISRLIYEYENSLLLPEKRLC